jgi:hypothetical protein
MKPERTKAALLLMITLLAVGMAGTAAAQAESGTLIPVAPPEGAELPYNIPLQAWLVPEVLALKSEFHDGLSAEFASIARSRTGDDLTTIIEAGRDLEARAATVGTSIRAIGEEDVTFGIDGISRIIPAESALRDTLFGYVVWHEFSSAPARGMMTRFEDLVGRIEDAGRVTGEMADQLASAQTGLKEAVEEGDAARIAELAPSILETAARVDGVCVSAASAAVALTSVVDSLSAGSGASLAEKWATARKTVTDAVAPAQSTGPALKSMSEAMDLVIRLGEYLGESQRSLAALSAPPDADGDLYVPWTVFRDDYELAMHLEHDILGREPVPGSAASQHAAQSAGGGGDEGEESHEHAHAHEHEFVGEAASEETKAHIASILPVLVQSDALMAERAVEYTSARVGYATDAIEERFLAEAHYSDSMDQDAKTKVFDKVDRKFRENMEYGVARRLMRAAREELTTARAVQARGAGSESQALYQYQNVWLFCLNAGASAGRAEEESTHQ